MKLEKTGIPDVVVFVPEMYEDELGWSLELFDELQFQKHLQAQGQLAPDSFVQELRSCTRKNAIREITYQSAPRTQGRLVQTIRGAAFHVVVDVRANSRTFGHISTVAMREQDQKWLWVPEGFAHGFLALEHDTEMLTKFTCQTDLASERVLQWDDVALGINWPISKNLIRAARHIQDNASSLEQIALKSAVKVLSGTEEMSFRVIGDHRGSLIALEGNGNIPFAVKRVYYIFDTISDVGRGYHAHKHLQQVAVCVKGKCKMVLDDGVSRKSVWLDSPSKALLISNLIWREMHDFSDDCVLLVLASARYDEADYIRNYEEFLQEVRCVGE